MDKYESSALPTRGNVTDHSPCPQHRMYQESLLDSVLKMRVRETENQGASRRVLHSETHKDIKLMVILGSKCGSEHIEDGRFPLHPNRWPAEQEAERRWDVM